MNSDAELSPKVMVILKAFYANTDGQKAGLIANPVSIPSSSSNSTYSKDDRDFAKNLVACQPYLSKMARSLCRTHAIQDHEDIVQMTMMKAWQDRKSLGDGNIQAWTIQILKHRTYDEIRKRRTRRVVFDESVEVDRQSEKADTASNPHATLEILQERIFPHIPIELRDVLTLRTLGYTIDEAGGLLGITRNAVHKREVRAHKVITELFSSAPTDFQETFLDKPDRPEKVSTKSRKPKHS